MSSNTNIETNVVQMKFDNAQFEKNCKETMSTLDKLKEKLHSTKSASSLNNLGETAKGLGLDAMDKSLTSINKKMSILGIAGATVISEMTKSAMNFAHTVTTAVPKIIKEGGWTRAMNIEQAKFQLEGLGIAWTQVGEQISNAVSGTAYSMDSAAKAASQLAASGIEISGVGDQMERTLKAISGVAAQTNSSYDDIASVFTTIAGNGRLMSIQLNQLASRGMNAAAALGKAMGVTEAEIRDMVSKGQISFDMFSDIMFETFGENAFKANQTFTGSLDNMKAALKRTGEAFAGPVIRQMIPVFNSLRQAINKANTEIFKFSTNNVTDQSKYTDAIKAAKERLAEFDEQLAAGKITQDEYAEKTAIVNNEIKQLETRLNNCLGPFEKVAKTIQERIVGVIDQIDFKFVRNIMHGFVDILKAGYSVLKPFGQAFLDVFGISTRGINQTLKDFSIRFSRFTKTLILSTEEMDYLKRAFRGVISVMSMFSYIIKSVLSAILGIDVRTGSLRKSLLKILGTIGDVIYVFTSWVKQTNIVTIATRTLMSVIYSLVGALALAIVKIGDFFYYISQTKAFQVVITVLQKTVTLLVGSVVLLAQKLAYIFSELRKGNVSVLGPLGKALEFIKNGVVLVVGAVGTLFEKIKGLPVVAGIVDKVTTAFEKLRDAVYGIFGKKNKSDGTITITDDDVPKGLEDIENNTNKAAEAAKDAGDNFGYFSKVLEIFHSQLSLAKVASIAFTAAILIIAYKTADALDKFGKGVKGIGSFMGAFAKKGLVGMILGTGDRTPNKIMDTAIALGVLTIALIGIANLPKEGLKQATEAVTGLMVGFTAMMGVLTYLDSLTGTLGGLSSLTESMLKVTLAIGGLAFAMSMFANMKGNIKKGIIGMTAAAAELVGIIILLSKFAPAFSVASGSLIGLAVSLRIMAGTFKLLVKMKDDVNDVYSVIIAFATFTGILVAIASFAQRLGGNSSFLRLSLSILALSGSMFLISKVLQKVDVKKLGDILDQWSKFFHDNLPYFAFCVAVGIGSLVLVFTTLKGIPKLANDIFGKLRDVLSKSKTVTDEVKGTVNYMAASLNKLGIAAIILSATAAIIALTGLAFAMSKLVKDKDAFYEGLIMVGHVAVLVSLLMVVAKATEKAKPSVLLASIMAIGVILGAIMAIGMMLEGNTAGTLVGFAGLLVIIGTWMGMLALMSKIKYDEASYKGIIASIVGVGVIVASIATLSSTIENYGLGTFIASITGLGLMMVALGSFLALIGHKGMSITAQKRTALLEMIAAIGAIAGSISLMAFASQGDYEAIAVSAIALGGVFAAFGIISAILGKVDWKPNTWQAFLGIAVTAVAIGVALSGLTAVAHGKEDSMIQAAIAITGVATILAVIARVLSDGGSVKRGLAAMLVASGFVLAVAGSLSMLAGFQWEQIQNALAGMAGAAVILSAVVAIMTAVVSSGIGALAVGLAAVLALAFAAIAAACAMLVTSLTAFLPVFQEFVMTVFNALVDNRDKLAETGSALLPFASGLAAVGAAGLILMATSNGLINGSIGILAIAMSMKSMQGIDFETIATGIKSILVPLVGLGAVSLILAQLAPAMMLSATAMFVFGAAVQALSLKISIEMVDTLSKIPAKAYSIGEWIPLSIAKGMISKKSIAVTTATVLATAIEEGIRNILQIHSNSPLFNDIGEWIPASMGTGIEDGMGPLLQSVGISMEDLTSEFDISAEAGQAGKNTGDAFIKEAVSSVNSGVPLLDMAIYKIQTKFNGVKEMLKHISDVADSVNNDKNLTVDQKNAGKNRSAGADVGGSLLTQKKVEENKKKNQKSPLDELVESLDNVTTSAGGASKATGKLTESVTDLSSAFAVTEKQSKVSLGGMINNLLSNYQATASWARDMKLLIGKGYNTAIVDWVKNMGTAGHETVKALLNGTAEEVNTMNTAMKEYLTLDSDAENYISGKYEAFGGKIALVLSDAIKTYDGVLAQTLQDALDPFSKFNATTEMTGTELLNNMNSQLKGFRTWGENLKILMGRNVDQGIIDEFKRMGISSYEEVNAMVHMTDAQLAEANEAWRQQLTIGEEVAIGLADRAREVGKNVTDGFTDGISIDNARQKGIEAGRSTIDGLMTGTDSHSPSRLAEQVGINVDLGLVGGMRRRYESVLSEARRIGKGTTNTLKLYMSHSTGYSMGLDLTRGMADGLNAGRSNVFNTISSLCTSLIKRANEIFERNSPSKVFRSMFYDNTRGMALGFKDGTGLVLNSVDDLGYSVIDRMNNVISGISDNINGDFENISPVISPKLDLENIQNGRSLIDRMFAGTSMNLSSSILSDDVNRNINQNDTETDQPQSQQNNQTIIFNQTNNSPKNIDPYESYRLNRLAAEQLKGAFA